jgi:hypothetical protein
MDQGPHLWLVPVLYQRFGVPETPPRHYRLDASQAQWDFVYPVSSFLDTYTFPTMVNDMFGDYPAVRGEVVSSEREGEGRRVVVDLDFVSRSPLSALCPFAARRVGSVGRAGDRAVGAC